MFVTETREHEAKALGEVRERLDIRFAGRGDGTVRRVVDEVAAGFAGARIREFVPVLVERIARDRLNGRLGAGAGAGAGVGAVAGAEGGDGLDGW